jgi:hypothetical protein
MGRKFKCNAAVVLVLTAITTGCASRPGDLPGNAPLARELGRPTANTPQRPAAGSFDLVWSYNNARVITISGNELEMIFWGQVSQSTPTMPSHNGWRRVNIQLTDDQTDALRKLLIDTKFSRLASEYDTNLADGTVVEVTLEQADYEQTVYCNNYFPHAIRELNDFLNKITKAHAVEIAEAPQIDQRQAVREILQASP